MSTSSASLQGAATCTLKTARRRLCWVLTARHKSPIISRVHVLLGLLDLLLDVCRDVEVQLCGRGQRHRGGPRRLRLPPVRRREREREENRVRRKKTRKLNFPFDLENCRKMECSFCTSVQLKCATVCVCVKLPVCRELTWNSQLTCIPPRGRSGRRWVGPLLERARN